MAPRSFLAIPPSLGAAAAYLGSGLVNLRLGLFLITATTMGAVTGAYLVDVVPIRALQIILGLTLEYSSLAMFRRIKVELPGHAPPNRLTERLDLGGTYYDAALNQEVT